MIELQRDQLVFSFPEIHPQARLAIDLQRTLRIPDDDRAYPLPPGLGRFPLRHVDDVAANVPPAWLEHGGVLLPMYQSEALWINFSATWVPDRGTQYPFAVKVATGKINAVTGDAWSAGLHRSPQDYAVAPDQPWLDGYCVEKGLIRQFVAMPLGAGYTAEEQITSAAEYGGLQIAACPMRRDVFERRFPPVKRSRVIAAGGTVAFDAVAESCMSEMGLAPGGRMRQEIYDDRFDLGDWAVDAESRCFVHIANSLVWRSITGDDPPTVPPTAREYTAAGLPWFEYYDETASAVPGSGTLNRLKSVQQMGKSKGDVPLPENASVTGETVVKLRKGLRQGQVREGVF
jgi:hypothetical protein